MPVLGSGGMAAWQAIASLNSIGVEPGNRKGPTKYRGWHIQYLLLRFPWSRMDDLWIQSQSFQPPAGSADRMGGVSRKRQDKHLRLLCETSILQSAALEIDDWANQHFSQQKLCWHGRICNRTNQWRGEVKGWSRFVILRKAGAALVNSAPGGKMG